MVYACVIDLFSTQCVDLETKINLLYLINMQIYLQCHLWRLRLHHTITKV
jgi:hypothetical protein